MRHVHCDQVPLLDRNLIRQGLLFNPRTASGKRRVLHQGPACQIRKVLMTFPLNRPGILANQEIKISPLVGLQDMFDIEFCIATVVTG